MSSTHTFPASPCHSGGPVQPHAGRRNVFKVSGERVRAAAHQHRRIDLHAGVADARLMRLRALAWIHATNGPCGQASQVRPSSPGGSEPDIAPPPPGNASASVNSVFRRVSRQCWTSRKTGFTLRTRVEIECAAPPCSDWVFRGHRADWSGAHRGSRRAFRPAASVRPQRPAVPVTVAIAVSLCPLRRAASTESTLTRTMPGHAFTARRRQRMALVSWNLSKLLGPLPAAVAAWRPAPIPQGQGAMRP